LISWLGNRLSLKEVRVYLLLALVMFFLSLPGSLYHGHGSGKVPFKQLGLALAKVLPADKVLTLCSTVRGVRYTHFYAHLRVPAAPSIFQSCRQLRVDELNAAFLRKDCCEGLLVVEADGSCRRLQSLLAANPELSFKLIAEVVSEKYGTMSLWLREPLHPPEKLPVPVG
jgi:hypothetical protein